MMTAVRVTIFLAFLAALANAQERRLKVVSPDARYAVAEYSDGMYVVVGGKRLQKLEEAGSDFMEARWSKDSRFVGIRWHQAQLQDSSIWKRSGKQFKRVSFEKMGLEQHLRKDQHFPAQVRWGVFGTWLDDDFLYVTFRALAPDDAPQPWDSDLDAYTLVLQSNRTSFRPMRLERTPSGQRDQTTVIWREAKP